MANTGDKVIIKTKQATEEGILMPSFEEGVVIIKLESNGYNIGFDKKKIIEMKVLEKKVNKHEKIIKQKINSKLQTIAVLHTGGTIASKVDYESGGVSAKFSASDLLKMVPELSEIANFETELISNMMSEDMFFTDYQKIAKAIQKYAKKGVDGIILGHGTDTLTHTATALAFMFEKINIPILIVGSQRSSDRGSSDAAMNLICASEFISRSDFAGIAICMHNTADDNKCAILSATKSRKMHTSRRDAFKPINDNPIALVDYKTKKVEFLKKDYHKKIESKSKKSQDLILLKDKFSTEVGLLKTHTNMNPKVFEFFTKSFRGIIIEGTGLGHAPTNVGENLKNHESLQKFIKRGGIVGITSQCLYGRVNPSVYTNLRRLAEIGCIFCEDMLPETAHIKLSWLLANHPIEEVKGLLATNMRGEINEPLKFQEEFQK